MIIKSSSNQKKNKQHPATIVGIPDRKLVSRTDSRENYETNCTRNTEKALKTTAATTGRATTSATSQSTRT